MDFRYLQSELGRAGWRDFTFGSYMGFPFDLVGRRKFGPVEWYVLVKALPFLSPQMAAAWRDNYRRMYEASQGLLLGKCFFMVLVVGDIAPELVEPFRSDFFGSVGVLRFKGGGGKAFVAVERLGMVLGTVPALPYDMHKFSKDIVGCLNNALRVQR